jgi:hypothetical protein
MKLELHFTAYSEKQKIAILKAVSDFAIYLPERISIGPVSVKEPSRNKQRKEAESGESEL